MKIHPVIFTLAALSPCAMAAQADTTTARLAVLTGTVDLRSNSRAAAKPAQNNALLAARNIINTNARARSEFYIGNTLVRLDAESELEISQLDAKQIILNLHYGSVFVQSASSALELRSAQGRVSVQEGAQLRMDAVTQPDAIALRLFSGNARFSANGAAPYELQAGTQFSLRGQGNNIASINRDEFDDWALDGQASTSDRRNFVVSAVSNEPIRRAEVNRETTTVVSNRPSGTWETESSSYPGTTTTTTTYTQPYYPVTEVQRTVVVNRYDPYWPVVPLVVGGLLWANYHHGYYGHGGYYRPWGYRYSPGWYHSGPGPRIAGPGHWRR